MFSISQSEASHVSGGAIYDSTPGSLASGCGGMTFGISVGLSGPSISASATGEQWASCIRSIMQGEPQVVSGEIRQVDFMVQGYIEGTHDFGSGVDTQGWTVG